MVDKSLIKVGYLISYDYDLLKYSLPTIYKYSDEIYLAIDKDRKTWMGNSYNLPDNFFDWIQDVDYDNKIFIYEDSFYISSFTPMMLETRSRNLLARCMGDGGWHIQIDVDEYFLNFDKFVHFLRSLNSDSQINIYAKWITIFKQDNSGVYYIDNNEEFPIATNAPNYVRARFTNKNGLNIISKLKVLHQSWGRSKTDLKLKLDNWGHANDLDRSAYLAFWNSIDKDNYTEVIDFHPFNPSLWHELKYIDVESIFSLIKKMGGLT